MAEPIQVDFAGKGRRQAPRKPAVIPPERAGLKVILSAIGSVLTALVGYYVMLPPLNPKAKEFYYYLALVAGSFILFLILLCRVSSQPEYAPYVKEKSLVPGIIVGVVALFFGVAWAVSSPFFQARKYSELLVPEKQDATFAQDIQEADFSVVPKLDEGAAKVVANKSLSALADYVSQFTIAESNTLINYREKPVRVMTLGYDNLIKWLTNTSQGLPGYVIVDMADEKSEFVKLEQRIRYSDAEHFGKLLKRHLRFRYPTYMFGTPTFEIDDDNNPYWIAPRTDKKVGLLGGEDVVGIILVDAVTGECWEYDLETLRKGSAAGDSGEEIDLTWIDRVFSASLLTAQYDFYGKYAGGFWNSLLGQQGVQVTTANFNYLAKDDDVLMYTGVTSVTADNSIIGFLLVNQRTKEALYYPVEGATEDAAKTVAEGLVQDKGWKSTFPLLINVGGQPTYFLTLQDKDYTRQGFAMVNVNYYNVVKVWGETVSGCLSSYVSEMRANGISSGTVDIPEGIDDPDPDDAAQTVTGEITDIRSAVIGGETTYYLQLGGAGPYYAVTAARSPAAVLLNRGDTVVVTLVAPPAGGAAICEASGVALKG